MKHKGCSGQIILDVLISTALFSLVGFSIATVLKDITNVLINGMEKQRAVYLAKEGLEGVGAINEDNFDELKSGNYGLKIINGEWELSKENQKENGFLRQINIENAKDFEETKKVNVKIQWEKPQFGNENSLDFSKYYTNPKTSALELNLSSYLTGDPAPWQGSAYTIIFSIKPKNLSQPKGAGLFANQYTSQGKKAPQLLQIESDGSSNYQLRMGENTFLIGPIQDKWTQLAITWNGNNLKIYYNGDNVTSQILSPNEGSKEFKNYLLGISSDKTKGFDGIYKNLMIFERPLSEKEISGLFSGKIPSLEGLKLYWKMNEGKGNSVRDFGPFNVSGKIVGSPLWKEILTLSSWKEVADF